MDPTLERSIRRASRSGKLPHGVIFSGSGDLLCAAHPDTDWRVCLEHAEKLGLGTRSYQLIKI